MLRSKGYVRSTDVRSGWGLPLITPSQETRLADIDSLFATELILNVKTKQSTKRPKSRGTKGQKQDSNSLSNMAIVGPGLVTGASDDDPSGIATYSQAGAQFGFATLWLALFAYPFMCAIQEISARIGRVTGVGISANIRKAFPRPVVYCIVAMLLVSSIFNLGADLGAMGEAAHLLFGGPAWIHLW
jgi:Natural resistance-associated macrophage protein